MATQEADRPQGKRRTSIFSGKLRIITIILGIIFALVGLIFWINGINNDNTHIDKIMGAIFTFLLLVCALLTIPFLNPSEESGPTAPIQEPRAALVPQIPSIQVNPVFNINQAGLQQLDGSTIPTGSTAGSNEPGRQSVNTGSSTPGQQHASSENTPGLNQTPLPTSNPAPSPSFNRNEPTQVDEGKLLDGLLACRPSVLGVIANCIRLPTSWHLSDKADPADQATNLMNWAKHPEGSGIEALNTCYREALGIGKKK